VATAAFHRPHRRTGPVTAADGSFRTGCWRSAGQAFLDSTPHRLCRTAAYAYPRTPTLHPDAAGPTLPPYPTFTYLLGLPTGPLPFRATQAVFSPTFMPFIFPSPHRSPADLRLTHTPTLPHPAVFLFTPRTLNWTFPGDTARLHFFAYLPLARCGIYRYVTTLLVRDIPDYHIYWTGPLWLMSSLFMRFPPCGCSDGSGTFIRGHSC